MKNTLWTVIIFAFTFYRLRDGGRFSLCAEYWPTREGSSEQYGKYDVRNNGVEKNRDYRVTSLVLQNVGVSALRQKSSRDFTFKECPQW
jgi:hypothetical protein